MFPLERPSSEGSSPLPERRRRSGYGTADARVIPVRWLRLARFPEKIAAAIRQATVLPGMTRDQLLMALGYPPGDFTTMLQSPNWRYPMPKDCTLEVSFDRDTVARVSQQ